MGCMEEMQRLRQALDSQRGTLEVSRERFVFLIFESFVAVVFFFFLTPSSPLSLSLSFSLIRPSTTRSRSSAT